MKDPPKSSERAIDAHERARSAVSSLRDVRSDLVGLLARVDAAIGEAEEIVDYVAGVASYVTALGVDATEATARHRLRAYGKTGEVVVRAAEQAGVPVRLVVGPGAPSTEEANRAREAAVDALRREGLSATDIATVIGVSFEAARRRVRKAAA